MYKMNETEIYIQQIVQKQDLSCMICLECIYPPFFQCNSAFHFICPLCYSKLHSDRCPCCRDNNLFKNVLLERHLKDHLMNCPHELCKKSIFTWNLANHTESCIYAASSCFFCESTVKPEEFKQHLTTQCEALEYAERGSIETKG